MDFGGTAAVYVQSLTGGAGAAWNARAMFPAASTLKLAIATTVLAQHEGIPAPGSSVDNLLTSMLTRSDNASANALEVWLAGSTSAGSHRINELMRSIGLRETEMYGGYELRTLSSGIPLRVDRQPAYGVRQAHDGVGPVLAVARGLARVGRPRAATHAADGVHGSRRPVPPVAPRARERRPEDRPRTHG